MSCGSHSPCHGPVPFRPVLPHRKIPNGIHGIEERLHVAWETLVNQGLITPSDFVSLTSTEAAKIFNVYPAKGVIQPGSDADVVIFDPTEEHTLSAATQFSVLDTSIYEGMRIRGRVSALCCTLHVACALAHVVLLWPECW